MLGGAAGPQITPVMSAAAVMSAPAPPPGGTVVNVTEPTELGVTAATPVGVGGAHDPTLNGAWWLPFTGFPPVPHWVNAGTRGTRSGPSPAMLGSPALRGCSYAAAGSAAISIPASAASSTNDGK